jgi:hypothetical protein
MAWLGRSTSIEPRAVRDLNREYIPVERPAG